MFNLSFRRIEINYTLNIESMYKNGEELTCKRNYKTHLKNFFVEGKSYYVKGALYEGDESRHVVFLADNTDGVGRMTHIHAVKIKEYFYTVKEFRKLKLEELNV